MLSERKMTGEMEKVLGFFGSRGTCCEGENSGYNVAVGRSKDLKGPYVDREGTDLMLGGGTLI
jgi:arabinan endo-1,5-alpha-L-arabinosidase